LPLSKSSPATLLAPLVSLCKMLPVRRRRHTLGTWAPYSSLDRDDPLTASFIDGVTLRTSLNLAVMGFGLTDMAIGAGILVLIAGVATVLLAAPGLYFLAGVVVPKHQRESSA
jgi:hypothetical protein